MNLLNYFIKLQTKIFVVRVPKTEQPLGIFTVIQSALENRIFARVTLYKVTPSPNCLDTKNHGVLFPSESFEGSRNY